MVAKRLKTFNVEEQRSIEPLVISHRWLEESLILKIVELCHEVQSPASRGRTELIGALPNLILLIQKPKAMVPELAVYAVANVNNGFIFFEI